MLRIYWPSQSSTVVVLYQQWASSRSARFSSYGNGKPTSWIERGGNTFASRRFGPRQPDWSQIIQPAVIHFPVWTLQRLAPCNHLEIDGSSLLEAALVTSKPFPPSSPVCSTSLNSGGQKVHHILKPYDAKFVAIKYALVIKATIATWHLNYIQQGSKRLQAALVKADNRSPWPFFLQLLILLFMVYGSMQGLFTAISAGDAALQQLMPPFILI